ncbi:uncharacterized protein LOC130621649 [Hydractinia symbiolongicarpus]|uniref:uncharacterized protein LOC130621649 n=1 Tax=Hydractinia symbiolongicarpus TaxID=13093 RepID=UPI00254AF034|nr:uncharacterized protein LOC130621649 [Hydractinia symbiolongicarpus]
MKVLCSIMQYYAILRWLWIIDRKICIFYVTIESIMKALCSIMRYYVGMAIDRKNMYFLCNDREYYEGIMQYYAILRWYGHRQKIYVFFMNYEGIMQYYAVLCDITLVWIIDRKNMYFLWNDREYYEGIMQYYAILRWYGHRQKIFVFFM